jgi:hypothetical protein
MKNKMYYIRTEGYSGNSLLWWRPNSQGYTTDLNKAGRYTKEEAESICKSSKSEVAYECDKVDNHPEAVFRTVHASYLQYKDADINFRKK